MRILDTAAWLFGAFGALDALDARHTAQTPDFSTARGRAAALVSQMTLAEKVNLTSGTTGPCQANSGSVARLGIPSLCYNDGPAGLRYTDFVTQFPSQFTTAMSFDRALVREVSERMGREFSAKGVNVQLGPLTGGPLGRNPFAGRNWEAFTPDPYLSSTLSYIAIRGLQASGLVTCAKHYFLYEQEPVCDGPVDEYGGRTGCVDIHSMVDDKIIKELYLPSFAEAVRAGTGAVMCSYNRINDTPACQSDDAMNRILKTELNFQGFVLSDFGATHSTVASANAGMDMELPGTWFYGDALAKAVAAGNVSTARLDDMATRILTSWLALGQKEDGRRPRYQRWNLEDTVELNNQTYHNFHEEAREPDTADFVRRVAEESHVMLKNDGVLPLTARSVGVFGSDADYPVTISGCGGDLFCLETTGRRHWNGTVTIGGGSGAGYATYIVPPIEGISLRGRRAGVRVDHVLKDDEAHYPAIAAVARSVQVCIVSVSLFLVEAWDRDSLRLDNGGEELIKHVAANCAGDVVVVLHAGGPVVMEDWIDLPNVKGVIFAGYPGQESGNALANVLWGDVSPGGRMAFTIGKREADWPDTILRRKTAKPRMYFSEGLAIDYKWFDNHNITPRFEFGFGLTYSTFALSDLTLKAEHRPDTTSVVKTNEPHAGEYGLYDVLYVATVKVANTGAARAAAVPQLYMTYPCDDQPRHLRGYAKVPLDPGGAAAVEFPLRKKDLAVWDVVAQQWHIPQGKFTFHAGESSRNLPLEVSVFI